MNQVSQKLRKTSLFTIFFTFAVDNLGMTIVFPIFAPLFLSDTHGLFDASYPLATRTIFLGLFLGAFPFAQFFLNPIFGEYADRQGRKRALLITTFLTFAGFAISAWSIEHRYIIPLFIGRIIMGVGAGNLSICLSALSDLSPTPKKKLKYFSYGSAVAGSTFVLGPFIGGKLSDPNLFHVFNKAFPMWIGAILSLINFFFIVFFFQETMHHQKREKFDLIKGIHNLQLAFKKKKLRSLYLVYFFFLFAWNIIFLFFPAYLVENYNSTSSTIGDISALMGICWILGTGVLHRIIHNHLSSKKILLISFFVLAVITLATIFPEDIIGFLIILGCCTMIAGLIWPTCTGEISNAADQSIQGKVLGLSQSMLSLTMMLAAFLGGVFLHTHSSFPFIFAAIAVLIAGVVLLKTKLE